MEISFDPVKRALTLERRCLDFADAPKVFEGPGFTQEDARFDYPERRFQTYGLLDGRLVMVVWADILGGRHIISMRKCNDREQARYRQRLD
ncbi:BrnT family toxin [Sphingomonas abietis]|uniref:BrnT family toxin n=1 Tax=Sphingomonas abietis TaxID=3012344 RepID=A0ABY7NJA1_9SPHN|nr:BrnT family toxin [Sphingomonas abietis]WBO21612.1 BrnT family toxin [Sphingomonas abietis]